MIKLTRCLIYIAIALSISSCDDIVSVSTQDYEGVYTGPGESWSGSDTTILPTFIIQVTSINADQNEPYLFLFPGLLVRIDNGVDGYYVGTHNDLVYGDINYEIQFNSDGSLVASCNWPGAPGGGGIAGGIQSGLLNK